MRGIKNWTSWKEKERLIDQEKLIRLVLTLFSNLENNSQLSLHSPRTNIKNGSSTLGIKKNKDIQFHRYNSISSLPRMKRMPKSLIKASLLSASRDSKRKEKTSI